MENVDIELLINLVRLKPYLYDKNDKRYKDLIIKENAWAKISETLNTERTACEKIWKSLKDKFRRERKKIKLIPSGSSCSQTKNLVWYADLLFLDGCMQEKRKTSSNLKDTNSMATSDYSPLFDNFSPATENLLYVTPTVNEANDVEVDEKDLLENESQDTQQIREEMKKASTPRNSTKRLIKSKINKENDLDLQIADTLKKMNSLVKLMKSMHLEN